MSGNNKISGPNPGAGDSFFEPNVDKIPCWLKDRDFWMTGRLTSLGQSDRLSKIYYHSDAPTRKVDLNDPSGLTSFQNALNALKDRERRFSFIGYNIGLDPQVFGIDRDHCLILVPDSDLDGQNPEYNLAFWAEHSRDQFPTYTEISVSGMGEHAIGRADTRQYQDFDGKPLTLRTIGNLGPDKTGKIEIFVNFGALVVTGNRIDDMPHTVEDLNEDLKLLLESLAKRNSRQQYVPSKNHHTDEWVVSKAQRERYCPEWANGRTSGEIFTDVFIYGHRGAYSSDLSAEDYWVANRIAFYAGPDPETILRIIRTASHENFRRGKWNDKRKGGNWLERDVQKILESRGPNDYHFDVVQGNGDVHAGEDANAGQFSKSEDDNRISIELTDRYYEVQQQTLDALATHPDVYRRGNCMATIQIEDQDEVALTQNVMLKSMLGTPCVHVLQPATVMAPLSKVACFYEWIQKPGKEPTTRIKRPPDWLLQSIVNCENYPQFRHLMGITESPFVRMDGSVMSQPGFDPATGVIYRPSVAIEPLPDQLRQEDAREASLRILKTVRQFPFGDQSDVAVILAGLLTAVNRAAIDGPVPGIALVGNVPGCGKGLLVDWIGCIAFGRVVPSSTYPDAPEEAAKVKIALALSGNQIVHFDNIEEGGVYGNTAMDSAITSAVVNDRLLGSPRTTGDIPIRMTWFLTGNNVRPGKDAYRRWLPCRLISPLEHPEFRDDIEISDLRSHILANRASLLRDILIILKAHADAGRPRVEKAYFGSFERWDDMIRGAVMYAIGQDPCATSRGFAEESLERLQKMAMIEGWSELPQGSHGRGCTVHEVKQILNKNPDSFQKLRDALCNIGNHDEMPSVKSIGKYISSIENMVIGGRRFVRMGTYKNYIQWLVTRA